MTPGMPTCTGIHVCRRIEFGSSKFVRAAWFYAQFYAPFCNVAGLVGHWQGEAPDDERA